MTKAEARAWRACDWNNTKVFLVSDAPRVCCPVHGVTVAAVPWANHHSRFTRDFEKKVAWHCLNTSKKAVSTLMRISWNTIGDIISRVREELDTEPNSRFDDLVRIGVDETSYKKGHKYITVVVNHDTGKVIWSHDGYGKRVFSLFFHELTEKQRASIRLVSGDGAKWIDECIEEFCPMAIRTIDPFHVVEWVTDALDKVRIDAWNDARRKVADEPKRKRGRPRKGTEKKEDMAKKIKGSRYTLWKRPEKLTDSQKAKLELIAKSDKRLYRAYLLKEKLRLIFQMDVEGARAELAGWVKWAQHCRIPVFVELQRKIRRHEASILASIEHGLSNARLEAINNKIKLSVRMAYGFRNIENLLSMVMLKCSDLSVRLPWESEAA